MSLQCFEQTPRVQGLFAQRLALSISPRKQLFSKCDHREMENVNDA